MLKVPASFDVAAAPPTLTTHAMPAARGGHGSYGGPPRGYGRHRNDCGAYGCSQRQPRRPRRHPPGATSAAACRGGSASRVRPLLLHRQLQQQLRRLQRRPPQWQPKATATAAAASPDSECGGLTCGSSGSTHRRRGKRYYHGGGAWRATLQHSGPDRAGTEVVNSGELTPACNAHARCDALPNPPNYN